MRKIALHWKIIIGLLFGILWAVLSSFMGWSQFTLNWIDPFGTIFINLLKLIAVPLVLFSIIKGISSLSDINRLGRMGVKTLCIYITTTMCAVLVGLLLVNLLKPGDQTNLEQRIDNRLSYETWVLNNDNVAFVDQIRFYKIDSLKQRINNLNISINNEFIEEKVETAHKTKSSGPLQFIVDMVPSNIFKSLSSNGLMLQIIFFAIFFGIVLICIPKEKAKPILDLVDGLNEVFLKMVDLIMQAAPFFVFALLAGVVSKMAGDDPIKVLEIFKALGWYSVAVVLGLFFMIFVFYPLLIKIFVKKYSYKEFFNKISSAQLLAFSTSSSVATLPVTMDCVEENLKVPKETSSFVLPIGATVNMDGTSLYQAVAVIFLAQFHMVDLTIAQQLIIVLTATLASIGAAAVPSAGLIMMILVLESVGLNPAWIAIVFPVDRILDMCRTVVNVTGDATVTTLVAKSENQI